MRLIKIALKSALSRRLSLVLTTFSIAISISLLLGVDVMRKQAKSMFVSTIANTDIIVGARSGPVNLLLYSVFRIGNATNNISYKTYQDIRLNPEVKWALPISLGDSHKGFRVMGTEADYFKFYQYADRLNLRFVSGNKFNATYDAVLGADVARELNYKIGDKIILAHGLVSSEFSEHKDQPFTISGILHKTGTVVDRTVHVSLAGLEAIHANWQTGTAGASIKLNKRLKPITITAFMLGLHNRIDTFRLQRQINEYMAEPLLAVIPGATLTELWQSIGGFEKVLLAISALVLLAGLTGLLTALLTSIAQRRREMAILRAAGAHSQHIVLLFVIEAALVVAVGCILGVMLLYILLLVTQPVISQVYGLHITIKPLDLGQIYILLTAMILAIFISIIPGILAYKKSLQDGLMIKV